MPHTTPGLPTRAVGSGQHGTSRREALKRIGLAAAVIAGLPAVAAGLPVGLPPKPPANPPKRINPRNGAAALPYQDTNNAAKIGVAGGISVGASVAGAIVGGLIAGEVITSSIPFVGPILSAVAGLAGLLISLFWPNSTVPQLTADDVWNMIKDRVAQMIDEKLQSAFAAYNKGTLSGLVAGLGCEVNKYYMQKSSGDSGYVDTFDSIENWCNYNMPQFQSGGDPGDRNSYIEGWHLLPQFVQVVNVYVMLALDVITPLKNQTVDPVVASRRLNALTTFLGDSIRYVGGDPASNLESTLKQAYDAFDKRYQDARSAPGSLGYAYPSSGSLDFYPGSYTADGVWQARRDRNDNHNQYVTLVEDYLQWWRKLYAFLTQDAIVQWHKNPSQPLVDVTVTPLANAVLDRELWYGPYGAANLADLGYKGFVPPGVVPSPPPDVQPPPATPSGFVSDYGYSRAWNARVDQEINPPWIDPDYDPNYPPDPPDPNRPPITVNYLWRPISHLQVVSVPAANVDAKYHKGIVKVQIVCSSFDTGAVGLYGLMQNRARGKTVIGVGLVREDGEARPAIVTDKSVGGNWGGTYDVDAYNGNVDITYDVAAPEGHILCNLIDSSDVSSAVSLLDMMMPVNDNPAWNANYEGIQRNPPAVGSMMCSFRFKDPTLVPPVKIVAQLYVTSGVPLTVREVAEAGRAWHRAMGHELSDTEVDALAEEIARLVVSDRLDEQRQAFAAAAPVVCTA